MAEASGAIVTLLPNIYQTNFTTSTNPFELTLFMSAGRGAARQASRAVAGYFHFARGCTHKPTANTCNAYRP